MSELGKAEEEANRAARRGMRVLINVLDELEDHSRSEDDIGPLRDVAREYEELDRRARELASRGGVYVGGR